MVDNEPRFEISDNAGSTVQASGAVGTTPLLVPGSATYTISEFIIHCPEEQHIDGRLKCSIDGGVNVMTLYPSGHWAWTAKGNSVKQLTITGNQANVLYEIVVNLEAE